MEDTANHQWKIGLKLNRVVEDLDRNLAILGIVAGGIIFIWLAAKGDRTFLESPLYLSFACAIYLAIRNRLSPLTAPFLSNLDLKARHHLILNILFFALFSYNVLSPFLDSGDYHRPAGYFVSAALMTALLTLEILSFKERTAHAGFILLKIVMVGLSLRWTPQLIFPDLVGSDPHAYRDFLTVLLDTNHNPGDWGYAKLPTFPLLIAFTMLITDLNYKLSVMFTTPFLEVIGAVVVFLLGRFIYNARVGLLAALLLAIASRNIAAGSWIGAQVLTLFLTPLVIYLLLKGGRQSALLTFLYLAFSALIILTHTIGAVGMAILLFTFWGTLELVKRVNQENSGFPISLALAVLFTVAMLGWWMYASGHITDLARLIKWGFQRGEWDIPAMTAPYAQLVSLQERVLSRIGVNIFFGFAIVGSLYMLSRRFGNKYGFPLVIGGFVLIAISYFALPLGFSGVLAGRWNSAAEVIMAVPAATGLLLIHGVLRNNSTKLVILVLLITIVSFFSITSPLANLDSPIYSKKTAVRYAATEAELRADETIGSFTRLAEEGRNERETELLSYIEAIYQKFPNYDALMVTRALGEEGMWANEQQVHWLMNTRFSKLVDYQLKELTTGDFSNVEDLAFLIRRQYVDGPFYVGSDFYPKLNYNPYQRLESLKFNQIYNSGSVTAYLKEKPGTP